MISNGKVQLVGSAASIEIPQDAQRLDRAGYTLIPGIVGMHDHLYYTDSYSIQVSGGKVGEPGLFLADIPIRLPDSIWRLA
ncbi:hypothetical protein [Tunturiibacter psychrotolerans]|uniref:hypothetical protein n=1 Tax=Tunturiibacter psychrotolerans TaxID=3069686 RepID=UPI003D2324EE